MKSKLPAKASSTSLAHLTPLQVYLQEISRYPLLEPEEEFELAKQHFEKGDAQAAHRLITANLRLVVKIANNFRKVQANLLDLIQEGNYGLMQAVKKFNPYKGVKLSSYAAWWIKAYILKYLMDHRGQVKIATTAAQRKLFYNLQKETDRLLNNDHETLDIHLLAEKLDVSEKDVLEMQKRLSSSDYSLDAPVSKDSESLKGDFFVDDRIEAADDFLANSQISSYFSEYLEEFKETLSGRDRDIFDMRLMNEKPLTLREFGEKYNISRERARQLEERIIKKLKDFITSKGVLDI